MKNVNVAKEANTFRVFQAALLCLAFMLYGHYGFEFFGWAWTPDNEDNPRVWAMVLTLPLIFILIFLFTFMIAAIERGFEEEVSQ